MKLHLSSFRMLLVLSCCLTYSLLMGQIKFKEQATRQEIHSGIVCGVADINGDFYDDILVLDQSKALWLGINNGSAYFFWKKIDYTSSQSIWSIAVADLDRNGYNDIIIGGDFYGIQVFYQAQEGFRRDTIENTQFYSQSSSIYDINKDGWLDFTICDDNAKTRIFENKKGELINNFKWIDLSMPDKVNEEGNYGCLWSDMDLDGDGDLYISKCSAKAKDNRADPRRINLYYQQNPDSSFTELAAAIGIASDEQSWTAVNGDVDGDNLPDILVANHYGPINVYIQDRNGRFEDHNKDSGIELQSTPFQFGLEDWDNDGDLDLLSVGTGVELWLNNGSGVFSSAALQLEYPRFTSLSWGDFNDDGKLDLYTSYAGLINNPSIVNDKMWLNQANSNHWVTFGLKGKSSNPNGIGALIKIYAGGKLQVREAQAGTSYGLQKSLNVHFGLGGATRMDSLFIQWPSGILDRYYDLPVDEFYLAGEGSCITPRTKIYPRGVVKLCVGEEVALTSYIQYSNLKWNNGQSDDTIMVDKTGAYFYQGLNRFNCPIVSENTTLLIDQEEHPKLNLIGEGILCKGEILELSALGYPDLYWNNLDRSATYKVDKPGKYFARYQGLCRDFYTDTVTIRYNEETIIPSVKADSLFGPAQARLHSDLDNTDWYLEKDVSTLLGKGKEFLTEKIDRDRSFWARSFTAEPFKDLTVGMKSPNYSGGAYPANFLNPNMYFEAYKDFTLDSITVYTDIQAERTFELRPRGDTNAIASITHLIKVGANRIYLGFPCKADNLYSLSTNNNVNIKNLGTKSPRLERSNQGFNYPFSVDDVCKISSSEYGDSYFYSFFNWKIHLPDHICYSDWVEVPVVVVTTGSKEPQNEVQLIISGNTIDLGLNNSGVQVKEMYLYDLQGKMHIQCNNCSKFEGLQLVSGLYILKVLTDTGDTRVYRFTIVK